MNKTDIKLWFALPVDFLYFSSCICKMQDIFIPVIVFYPCPMSVHGDKEN